MPDKNELVRDLRQISREYNLNMENQVEIELFAEALDTICSLRAQVKRDTLEYDIDDVEWGASIFCFPLPFAKLNDNEDNEDDDPEEDDKPKLKLRKALLQQVEDTGDLQVLIPHHVLEEAPGTIYDFLISHPDYDNVVITLGELMDEFEETDEAIAYISNYRR